MYNQEHNVVFTYIYLLKYRWYVANQDNSTDWITLTIIGNSHSPTVHTYFRRTNE
jgi:hypothetical protein